MKYLCFLALTQAVRISPDSFVQTDIEKVEEVMPHFEGYHAAYSGFEGNNHNGGQWRDSYERVIPENLTGDTADTFT